MALTAHRMEPAPDVLDTRALLTSGLRTGWSEQSSPGIISIRIPLSPNIVSAYSMGEQLILSPHRTRNNPMDSTSVSRSRLRFPPAMSC